MRPVKWTTFTWGRVAARLWGFTDSTGLLCVMVWIRADGDNRIVVHNLGW